MTTNETIGPSIEELQLHQNHCVKPIEECPICLIIWGDWL